MPYRRSAITMESLVAEPAHGGSIDVDLLTLLETIFAADREREREARVATGSDSRAAGRRRTQKR